MIATVRHPVAGERQGPRIWWARRHDPVDASILAFFRIAFGAILAWEFWRYVTLDRPRRYFAETGFHFTYWPFDWVRPLPDPWLTYLYVGLALCGALVALGVHHRIACGTLAAGLGYTFLLDRTYYLNHWYLSVLVAFLLALTPADRMWAVDARRSGSSSGTVPRWTVQVLRFQLGVVYVFGGLAKFQPDWLTGKPLEIWVRGETDVPVIGPLLAHRSTIVVMAVAAAFFDLLIVPLLVNVRTRRFAYLLVLGFHLLNSRLFSIGMFPWLMMLATVIFFPNDFPRRMVADLREGRHRVPTVVGALVVGYLSTWVPEDPFPVKTIVGCVAGGIAAYLLIAERRSARAMGDAAVDVTEPVHDDVAPERSWLVLRWVIAAFAAVQLLLPLRPYVYPNDPSWSEEGHMFSWRMMLRTKSGSVIFTVTDPATGRSWTVDPAADLNEYQVEGMPDQPEMLVQYAQWIEPREQQNAVGDVRITADARVSMNGYDERVLIDPNLDLTTVRRPWLPPAEWISDAPG